MAAAFTTRPEIAGTFGVVTSTHWIGSAVGMSILEKGGNAFDAAAATGFALQIVEPHLNGPGGEVPIIFWKAGAAAPRVICGQGWAPMAATIAAYEERGLRLVPGTGLLSAVVPGAFDAWMLMLRDHGTMPLEDVLAPAISYAENGFPLVHRAVQSIFAVEQYFRDEWPSSAQVWLVRRASARPGRPIPNAGNCRDLSSYPDGGQGGRRRSRPADRGGAGLPFTRASSPKRSNASIARPCWTPPGEGMRAF